jgi:hypothetical protein
MTVWASLAGKIYGNSHTYFNATWHIPRLHLKANNLVNSSIYREERVKNRKSHFCPILKVERVNEEQLNNSIFCTLSLSLIMN